MYSLDGASYKQYKGLSGDDYEDNHLQLTFLSIQADPFARPSRVAVSVPEKEAGFPPELADNTIREIAWRDYLARRTVRLLREGLKKTGRGSGHSSRIELPVPGQEILDRSSVRRQKGWIRIIFHVGLPAQGRRILGREAARLLTHDLPQVARQALDYSQWPQQEQKSLTHHWQVAEDAEQLRQWLEQNQLIAFVANGAILPRRSGVDDRPMSGEVIPFRSPPEYEKEITLNHYGAIKGMAVSRGINLIVGGGFHGKSTLLQALALAIYNHVPGDGREYVVSDKSTLKVRAEDGRSVAGVTISPFVHNLPLERDTESFFTQDASGSTSQAAGIVEAVEAGSQVLLIDEDTSATNFMIRDSRMQKLVHKDHEPITPFIDRIGELYHSYNISTILVLGGSGDYLDVAHEVICMIAYEPYCYTQKAAQVVAENQSWRHAEGRAPFHYQQRQLPQNALKPWRMAKKGQSELRVKVKGLNNLQLGKANVHFAALEQLRDIGQNHTIALLLEQFADLFANDTASNASGRLKMAEIAQRVEQSMRKGLSQLDRRQTGELAAIRGQDLIFVLNRIRGISIDNEV